jgi:indole-3-glycerol phosphate synthase
MNILDQIVIEKKNLNKYLKQKKFYIKKNSKKKSLFRNSILQEIKKGKNGLIAEFKRFSPSVKNFSKIKSIQNTIEIYDKSKCCCISILTDKNFGGSLNDITIAKKLTKKPIIRKDFILDKIQVLESKLYGADAILLIAKILTKKQVEDLYEYANELKLDVLIEIESIHEISKIKNIKNSIIGINNRNLKEQIINIDKSIYLSHLIKNENLIVSESGIGIKNIKKIKTKTNISSFLIGGSILNSGDTLNYINKLYHSS